jgi:light-regulated signal transduction histidine kinase (bacteriophytochrome)
VFLEEECAPALDERGRGYLQRMLEATARMGTLIDDLLQFAHASRAELRRRPVDLSALAQEVVRDLQQAAPERRVQFLCAPGLNVSGDARLLRVVLVNLLGNAWKYTGKAAEPRVEFGRLNGDGETAFFVRDNGAGFDMRCAHRLFGAFQRLHSMAEFEGTGVGLATVQRIVHRHGGKIWAEAKVNEGATFYLTLPTRKEVNL